MNARDRLKIMAKEPEKDSMAVFYAMAEADLLKGDAKSLNEVLQRAPRFPEGKDTVRANMELMLRAAFLTEDEKMLEPLVNRARMPGFGVKEESLEELELERLKGMNFSPSLDTGASADGERIKVDISWYEAPGIIESALIADNPVLLEMGLSERVRRLVEKKREERGYKEYLTTDASVADHEPLLWALCMEAPRCAKMLMSLDWVISPFIGDSVSLNLNDKKDHLKGTPSLKWRKKIDTPSSWANKELNGKILKTGDLRWDPITIIWTMALTVGDEWIAVEKEARRNGLGKMPGGPKSEKSLGWRYFTIWANTDFKNQEESLKTIMQVRKEEGDKESMMDLLTRLLDSGEIWDKKINDGTVGEVMQKINEIEYGNISSGKERAMKRI